ncbi:bifunctional proline dehydrogenase/L-glutamate gamma-semialdehyde dehydrogenase PutA [Pseudoalteromonas sp. A22]|uniref:bifunctional proline dehydrogenase/L-glutamate gamma-semialdehyde dehydrogenase PutA n=1 Tax=Pseudoalteromonas TaxID=53246 RepID=UPI001BA71B90|nr:MULTISPECIES: bifunctional proline dehydrogenase/L-glutamate gamma-semialdehyde dehydrogenase PutA [Pseudoalteromonas]MCG9770546.1 bifunctional proline dehydrogenase/L-glutamate gamma-semialdehyde dehydrogenase PutA [Pseudoalteromonas piscicida]QUI64359.1 bifunctional proline dehydrogenase/L-glutamate gamma-semialdehyde dehydrogenase PutA [Pseudoalteromonas sp. A22]USE70063.1 trifunctional transcriptional regulator/proline dehydrogenase/L-glutamate gamma-semialdehyde dehydrogenase [Pseudoalte
MLYNGDLTTNCPIRQKIRDFYRIDENAVIDHILPLAEVGVTARSRAWERARQMVLNIRRDQDGQNGVDALLNEFSLSTEEGVVLMCLAEALLRVPDKATQESLIRDKLAKGDWSSHLGSSDSLFVNASSWGLLVTGKMVNYSDKNKEEQFGVLKRTIGRLGEPVIRKSVNYAMKIMGKQFVMGETIQDAIDRAADKEQKGYVYSYDMLGEGARTMKDADRYFQSYMTAIHAIGKAAKGRGPIKSPGISVKLSAIHPRYEFTHRDRVMDELVPKLKELAIAAKEYDIGFTVDAEEADRLDISLDVIEAVFSDDALGDWNGFGLAVQAYQKRAIFVVEWVAELARRVGRKLMVRLVKGAYWDTEIKTTQQDGLEHFPVFTRKATTDVSYKACAIKLLEARDVLFPQFATHNAYTAATILEVAKGDNKGFEFQRLHGMGESLYDQIVENEGIQCRVYAPVGQHEDLLAYLVRRLLENGANSSFVNAIVDTTKPVESLLPDPVETLQGLRNRYNTQIKLPIELYGDERPNSKGKDLTDINDLTPFKESLDNWFNEHLIDESQVPEGHLAVRNPANHKQVIGSVPLHDEAHMQSVLANADAAFESWSQTSVEERANLLRRTADILERHHDELVAICIKEAGKVTQDSIDEVREAVDFCRYYAARAEELSKDERFEARGVILCISPWNFPLAIFLGQVAAAIVTGNTVIAKPAEQTSMIALRCIELMHTVGLPEHVVQPVIARGSEVGKHIVPDERIQAVMFTGSTETGTLISQILAERNDIQVPLIAETGGQNCMIVDSTALPEQVVDDVISSGFQSAGQRCSALRVLFLQEDVADGIIEMIQGALKELHIGDPSLLSTDVGPVIDEKALTTLTKHVDYMKSNGKLLFEAKIPDNSENGAYFFAPRLYEISDLSVLKREVFGPVVHVVRFKADQLDNVIDQINGTGYGLTMGVHSRIEERCEYLAKMSRAGNVYVNRNMIGAIVGVQPFGGRGLSGTGPKAGGPNYLVRLVKEKASPDNVQMTDLTPDELEIHHFPGAVEQVEKLMQNSKRDEKIWRRTALNDRVSAVRQLLAKVATVDIIDELADDLSLTLSDARAQLNRLEKRMRTYTTLPGPTGESNTLHLEARGCVVVYADKSTSFNFWAISIITALAAGNTVITVASDLFYEEALAFRDKFISTGVAEGVFQVAKQNQLQAILAHPHLAGAVVAARSSRLGYFSQQLAERKGAILPVISAEYYDTLINRLVTEKTISIDTTASGGNTSLMTLVEDEE